jgi:hypothetical protein
VGVVNQAVENAVGQGGIADLLASEKPEVATLGSGTHLVAILADLQVAALRFRQGSYGPVVDHRPLA